jgi:ABC-2 type transport system permease protein
MMPRLWPIAKKEFMHLFRDPRSLALMAILPVFLLILYGYAASFDVKNIPLAVLDRDNTLTSREYIAKFTHSGYFKLVENLSSDSQFADRLDGGRAKMIMHIPPGFSRQIANGKKAEIQVIVDGSDPTWASSALAYLNVIGQEYQQGLVSATLVRKGIRQAPKLPIDLVTRIWYNETLRSINFYIPGLIAVILMQISATLTSMTIVSEKEQGTMEALVVSPVKKNELMLGKILPYVAIAFADVMLITAIGVFWFQVPFRGSFLLLAVSSLIFLTGAMGLGIFFSANAKSSQEAMQLATLATMLPSILLSGLVFPIENMPLVLQGLSLIIPARYFLDILRGIFLKGVGFFALWQDFVAMTILCLFFLSIAFRRFHKRIE